VDATGVRSAGVIRADVLVVAIDLVTGKTQALGADVDVGALVVVVARGRVVRVVTAVGGVAGIISAGVLVVAGKRKPGQAGATSTLVLKRAGIQVIARSLVGSVSAAASGVADVVRAWIGVSAGQFP